MNLDFSDFPLLSTDRLILRQLVIEDAQQIHQLRADPNVNKHLDRAPSTSAEDAKGFIQKIGATINNNEGIYWVIALRESREFVGTICLYNFDLKNNSVEIGYELLPVHQRKGIMNEAMREVIKYGFETLQAKLITAFPSAANTPSVKLLEKTGFKKIDDDFANTHDNVNGMLNYMLENTGN